jgi:DNA-binding ferritin-like protein (Dps family)
VSVKLTTTLHTKYSQLPDPNTSLVIGVVTDSIATRQRYVVSPVVSETTQTVGDETTHIVRTDQVVKLISEYQISKVTVREAAWANEEIFIYKQGTGNAALDALFKTSVTAGTFFPVIPVRIDNRFVSSDYYGDIHPWVEKAVRRATNFTYEKLVEQVSDNPSLGDIDYAYMVFGASLNTPENTAKRYIYEFFKRVGLANGTSALNSFWTNYSAAVQSWSDWVKWYTQLRHVSPRDRDSSISYEMPERLAIPELPVTNIVVSAAANYSVVIGFSGVAETTHAGKFTPTAKVNELRIYSAAPQILYGYPEYAEGSNSKWGGFNMEEVGRVEAIVIEWQVSANTYRRLRVTNPTHTNYVYEGRAVKISSSEALSSGNESGFIIPMQDEVLRALPLTVATQLVTASNYLVFNCYKTVKQEWYETAFFKFILIIVIVVVAVYTGTDGGMLSGGLLGSNAAVGATLGFVGTTAIVVGAIANAIVGMIVSQVISRVSVKVFGEKFGSIIGAIASIVVLHVGTGMASGQPMGVAFSNMMNAENLMKLTVSTVDGLSQYVQSTAQDYANQTQDVIDDYTSRMKEITEKYLNDFGPGNGADIQTVQQAVVDRLEKPEVFLARTLLTGTDIADMSHSMLDNFTEFSVSPNLE